MVGPLQQLVGKRFFELLHQQHVVVQHVRQLLVEQLVVEQRLHQVGLVAGVHQRGKVDVFLPELQRR